MPNASTHLVKWWSSKKLPISLPYRRLWQFVCIAPTILYWPIKLTNQKICCKVRTRKFTRRNYGDEAFSRTRRRSVYVTSTRTRCRNKFAKNLKNCTCTCTCRVRVHVHVQVRILKLSNICYMYFQNLIHFYNFKEVELWTSVVPTFSVEISYPEKHNVNSLSIL